MQISIDFSNFVRCLFTFWESIKWVLRRRWVVQSTNCILIESCQSMTIPIDSRRYNEHGCRSNRLAYLLEVSCYGEKNTFLFFSRPLFLMTDKDKTDSPHSIWNESHGEKKRFIANETSFEYTHSHLFLMYCMHSGTRLILNPKKELIATIKVNTFGESMNIAEHNCLPKLKMECTENLCDLIECIRG